MVKQQTTAYALRALPCTHSTCLSFPYYFLSNLFSFMFLSSSETSRTSRLKVLNKNLFLFFYLYPHTEQLNLVGLGIELKTYTWYKIPYKLQHTIIYLQPTY